MHFARTAILLFFFFSGMTGLVFEVIWSRMLTRVFGSTTFALSALLTAFMAGLAIGSEVLGRRADRVKHPLRMYGILEICIGLYALLVPLLLAKISDAYEPLFQHLYDDFYTFSILRFILVFVVLVIPTFCMGATLPLLTQYTARFGGAWEGRAGLLYGMNTFGACVGTALSGFYLLPTLGQSTTNTTIASMSCALGVTVIIYSALAARQERAQTQKTEETRELLDELQRDLFADEPEHTITPRWIALCLLGLAVAGGVSMVYQVLWTRAYVMLLGSSTYSFSLILTTFLVGLASGSALMSALLHRIRRPVFWVALIQFGVALFGAVCFFTLNKAPELLLLHLRSEASTPVSVMFYGVFLIALVVLIPTLLQGMTFPLVVQIVSSSSRHHASTSKDDAGKLVGRAYALNTVGAILGSFLSGFVLLPWIGLRYGIILAIVLSILVGAAFSLMALRAHFTPQRSAALGAALLVCVGVLVAAPELNLTRLSSGVFRVYWAKTIAKPEKFLNKRSEALFYNDGVAATITVERRGGLLTLKSNGKPEASSGADMGTQILVGLLPLVMHESTPHAQKAIANGTYKGVEDVAMVGFGSGVTAGASLTYPLKNMDVVEIEPAMLEASRFFDEVNHYALDDPRLRVIESDGRNFLEYIDQSYDVIVSEPSNPWIAGVASLFTVEHFERARRKLKPGGIFCQWVQLYEMHPENVGRVFKTFRTVFPHAMIFSSIEKSTDLIMIGSQDPLTFTPDAYPRAFADPSIRRELARAGVKSTYDIPALLFLGDRDIQPFWEKIEADLGHEIVLNTDDNAILEFETPKDMIRYEEADRFFVSIYYGKDIYGDMRPYLHNLQDPTIWTPQTLARLSQSTFSKGKQELAFLLAEEALKRGHNDLAQDVSGAWKLFDTDPIDTVIAKWPNPNSIPHRAIQSARATDDPLPALKLLYKSDPSENDLFKTPEYTLATAWLFIRGREVKRAHRQLLSLIEREPQFVRETPLVHLLLGFTWTRRRDYGRALGHFMAYMDATR